MKIHKYFIGLVSCLALTACNDWLDLQPQDTTEEEQLFETGDGYRNALNGIYRQMATSGMYGKELTWGALDAMAQYYSAGNGYSEYYFSEYNYNRNECKSVIGNVWTTAYNSIANCCNLIQRVSTASATLFKKGQEEKDLIHGEALALRAILHFDILRLFAPGPKRDDGMKYVPYVEKYPITFQEYLTNDDFLKKVTDDLIAAKELVGKFDLPRPLWMECIARFENDQQHLEGDGPDDMFFAYRGYRLNYYAICGMLARVYQYRGMYKEAFDETEIVVNAMYNESGSLMFDFNAARDVTNSGNTKLYKELLFCLSNQKLIDSYETYHVAEPLNLSSWDPFYQWFNDDPNEVRAKLVVENDWDYVCSKYLKATGHDFQFAQDMLPMIRLGEMYLIRAEYYNSIGNVPQALEELATLRRGHGCAEENVDTDESFETMIINEARREFMQEGQLFFYYKRLNVNPTRDFDAQAWRWAYPDNEVM